MIHNRNKKGQFVKGHKLGMTGKKHSIETRKKMSDSNPCYWRNKHRSLETRKKMSIASKGLNTWMKGRKLSKETRQKISEAQKGMKKPWAKPPHFRGEKNSNWQGGRFKKSNRWYIYKPNHPFAIKSGYMSESRLIMEKSIGRYLKPKEIVHHINSITDDNRLSNLWLFRNMSEHTKYHCNVRLTYART